MSSRAFYSIALSFFFGTFLASVTSCSFRAAAFIAVLVSASFGVRAVYRRDALGTIAVCACLVFLGGVWWTDAATYRVSSSLETGKAAVLEGYVCDEPRLRGSSQSFCFLADGISDRLLVTVARYPEYSYGEALVLSGKVGLPENFESYEGGPIFDYVSYLAKDGIGYTMYRPVVTRVEGVEGEPVLRGLFAVKTAFMGSVRSLFPEPESSLLGGLLLGDRSSLPKDVKDDFIAAGLVHMLVLSGYNVTIVAEGLMKAFSFLPRAFGRGMGALSIILFALMTGATATTVRASIMALIVIAVRSSSRRYDATRALIAAAVLMVIHKPAILAFDVSFQLSFLATLSLIYVSPLVSAKLGWVSERWHLREILSATIATQLFVFPYLIYTLGQVSLISLVTNILVLPFVPYAMLLGFASASLGFLSQAIALPVAWAGSGLLSYMLYVANISARVPFAAIRIEAGALALASIYILYAVLLIRAWRLRNSIQRSAS